MKSFPLLVLCITIFTGEVFSQCSDAGVCIIGKYHRRELKQNESSISFGYIFGTSGKDPDINGTLNNLSFGTVFLEADINIAKNFWLDGGIPYSFISGPLGENNGIGDLILVFSRSFMIKKTHRLTFSLGGKFATGKVNSDDTLPQRYMPGLGTNDLLAGATYTYQNYYFGAGYQKPFGRSSNYETRLKRGDDLLFRAGFFEQLDKIGIKAEVLTILRIQTSSVRDPNGPEDSFVEIDGTNETQVNLLTTVSYRASKEIGLTGQAAIPFLPRNYNYDGLKRTLAISGSVSYFFGSK